MNIRQYIPKRESLRWLFGTMRGYTLRIVLCALIGTLRIGISLAVIWISKEIVDIATRQMAGNLEHHIALLVALMVGNMILGILSSLLNGHIQIGFTNHLRYRIFAQVLRQQWTGKDPFHTGDTINRIQVDIGTVSSFICSSIPSLFLTLLQLAGATVLLFMLERHLLWIILGVTPFALLFSKLYYRTMRELTRQIREMGSQLQSHIQENLQNRILLLTLGRTPQALERTDALQETLKGMVLKRLYFSLRSGTIVQVGMTVGYFIAFLWGIYGLQAGTVTFGTLTAFLQLVFQVQRPFSSLGHYIPTFVHTMTSTERLIELTGRPQEAEEADRPLKGAVGVRLEEVTFTYPENATPTLRNLTFDFRPGSRTAIIGETGAGKSTLIRVILSLLRQNEGRVVLYNGEEEVISSPATRCNFRVVPQGNSLMSGTIRENLLMGNPEATEEQMREALYIAAAEFVLERPEGLDTACNEKGGGLNEGQAQRIAIARALLHPGSILILDEASSALDRDTEIRIIRRISEKMKEKTLLWITHHEAVAECMEQRLVIREETE